MDIERSDEKGYIQLKIQWREGLVGEGTLIGTIAADGKLSATGTISENVIFVFRPSKAWDCNLTGFIRENKLKGTYRLFPKTVGESTPPIPGYPKWTTEAAEGSFDLEKFKPLVQPPS